MGAAGVRRAAGVQQKCIEGAKRVLLGYIVLLCCCDAGGVMRGPGVCGLLGCGGGVCCVVVRLGCVGVWRRVGRVLRGRVVALRGSALPRSGESGVWCV